MPAAPRPHAVIVGGGVAGLAAARDLARADLRVTVLEASSNFGGLASSFRLEGYPVERFYHFICRRDAALVRLVEELGLRGKLSWRTTRSGVYYHGRWYTFGTPGSLLAFDAVPWVDRLRFGLHVLRSRFRTRWEDLDDLPARDWLIAAVGRRTYEAVWHPLLSVKFGPFYASISAAWLWHRIWRVAASRRSVFGPEEFGYLEYGSATLVDALVQQLRAQPNVELRCAPVAPLVLDRGVWQRSAPATRRCPARP